MLFLDEPTTGLDPAGRRDVWDAIRALVAGGTTVLLTTQYLEEAEQLADDVCVLDGGRVVARGTPRELTAAIGGDRLELVVADPGRAREAARWPSGRRAAGPSADPAGAGERVVVPVARRRGVVGAVVRALDEAGIAVDDVVLRPTTLDEAYLRITGAGPRADGGAGMTALDVPDERAGRAAPLGGDRRRARWPAATSRTGAASRPPCSWARCSPCCCC